MTDVKEFLVNIKPHSKGNVSFGDGTKALVLGKVKLGYLGFSVLNNVDLIVNLISDQNFEVYFLVNKCYVSNGNGKFVMSIFAPMIIATCGRMATSLLACVW